MDLKQFLINIIEQLISSLPQLILLLTTTLGALKKIKLNTFDTVDKVNKVKTSVLAEVNEIKTVFFGEVDTIKNELFNSYNETRIEIKNVLEETTKKITEEVKNELSSMKKELEFYKESLIGMKQQTNLVVKENVAYMQLIAEFLEKDYDKIKTGIAQKVLNKFILTKKELQEFPDLLTQDIELIKKSLIEIATVSGEEKLDEILKELGYEKREEEKLQIEE